VSYAGFVLVMSSPVSHLIRKRAPPGQSIPVFTIGDQPMARRGLKLI
jgi:hypothetical protein